MFIQQVLNGLSIGGVYAIFAVGYTLVFSILGIINFTHGAIFTLGAYFTFALLGGRVSFNGVLANSQLPALRFDLFGTTFTLLPMQFIPAMIGGAILAGLFGVLVERLAFRPLRARGADPLLSLVSSLAIVNLIQYLVGAENYTIPSSALLNMFTPPLTPAINFGTAEAPAMVRSVQLIILGVSLVMVTILTLFINLTKTGKALRAVAEDPVTASLLGIDTDRLIMVTFFVSGFVGGMAGTLVGASVAIAGPYFGIAFGLKGLAVIVLGGLGDIPGAIVGGLIIGLAEAFVPADYVAYKDAIAFAILFIVLLVRPQGILGRALVQKV
jgi:branched-chain amino acid transport system permease protein